MNAFIPSLSPLLVGVGVCLSLAEGMPSWWGKERSEEEVKGRKSHGRDAMWWCGDDVQICGGGKFIIGLLACLLFEWIPVLQQNHDFHQ